MVERGCNNNNKHSRFGDFMEGYKTFWKIPAYTHKFMQIMNSGGIVWKRDITGYNMINI